MEKIILAKVDIDYWTSPKPRKLFSDLSLKEFIESFLINQKFSDPFDCVYNYADNFSVLEERKGNGFVMFWSLYLGTPGLAEAIINPGKNETNYEVGLWEMQAAVYWFWLFWNTDKGGVDIVDGVFFHTKWRSTNIWILTGLLEKFYSTASVKITSEVDPIKIEQITEEMTWTLEFDLEPTDVIESLKSFWKKADTRKVEYWYRKNLTSVVKEFAGKLSDHRKFLNCKFEWKMWGAYARWKFDFEKNVLIFASKFDIKSSEEKIDFDDFQDTCKDYIKWYPEKESKVAALF